MKSLIGSVLIAAVSVPAIAADMAVPITRTTYSWTGFYVGVNAGVNLVRTDPTVTFYDPNGFLMPVVAAGGIVLPSSHSASGATVGGQFGYNLQIGNWLLGAETDYAGLKVTTSQTLFGNALGGGGGLPIIATTSSQTLNGLGTTRARLGFIANSNWLLFGTGGLAYGRVSSSTVFFDTTDPTQNFSSAASDLRLGWSAGGGVEYGSDRWSAKIEYIRYDLGNKTTTGLPSPGVSADLPGSFFTLTQRTEGQIVRAGLNLRL